MLILAAPTAAQTITVAIADFRNETGLFVHSRLEKTIPEMLKTDLAQTGSLTVVERSRLQAVFEEQALGQSGILQIEQAQQVGRMVGAQYVISGEISRQGGRLRVDAHIVRVETGEVAGEKVTGPDAEAIEKMVHLLARNVAYNLTGAGSAVSKVRVHEYPFYWAFAGAAAAGVTAGILHHTYRQEYDRYQESEKFDNIARHYDRANRYYHARNAALGVGAAALLTGIVLWMQNIREDNYLLCGVTPARTNRLVIAPAYDAGREAFTLKLAWHR